MRRQGIVRGFAAFNRAGSDDDAAPTTAGNLYVLNIANARRAIAHNPESIEEVQELLRRYTDINEQERDRVAEFLRHGAPIDVGLLSSDPELWRAAGAFKAHHPQYFTLSRRFYIGWAAAITMLTGGLVLIKDLGPN
jgi:hypothetical protein